MNLRKIQSFLRPTHFKVRFVQYSAHFVLLLGIAFAPSSKLFLLGLMTALIIHGIGSGCGAHRYWSHKSFQTSSFFEWVMGILFTLSTMGSVIGYVVIHRNHHTHSDSEKDPHNPYRGSPMWAWLGFFDKNNLKLNPKTYIRLLKDRKLAILHNYYFLIIFVYLTFLVLIEPIYLVYFYALPVVFQFHVNSILIVAAHSKKVGYRNFDTKDNSKNLNWIFKFVCLGEELHNNHHKLPSSPTMNLTRTFKEFDPLEYLIILVLDKKKGLARWI